MISFLKKLFNFSKSKEVVDPYSYCKDWGYKPTFIPVDEEEIAGKILPKDWKKVEFSDSQDYIMDNHSMVLIEAVIERLRKEGFTQKQIAQQTQLTQNQVKGKLQKLLKEGKIERKRNAKIV